MTEHFHRSPIIYYLLSMIYDLLSITLLLLLNTVYSVSCDEHIPLACWSSQWSEDFASTFTHLRPQSIHIWPMGAFLDVQVVKEPRHSWWRSLFGLRLFTVHRTPYLDWKYNSDVRNVIRVLGSSAWSNWARTNETRIDYSYVCTRSTHREIGVLW